jgi:hypothetical protein
MVTSEVHYHKKFVSPNPNDEDILLQPAARYISTPNEIEQIHLAQQYSTTDIQKNPPNRGCPVKGQVPKLSLCTGAFEDTTC